jgi:hypothetical protein
LFYVPETKETEPAQQVPQPGLGLAGAGLETTIFEKYTAVFDTLPKKI